MIEKLIEIAVGEIGKSEPKGDDKYIKYYNETGGMSFNMNVAWCAIFVTWCKAMAGVDKSIIPQTILNVYTKITIYFISG